MARSFSGGSYLQAPNSAVLDIANMTVAGWLKTTATVSNDTSILGRISSGSRSGFNISFFNASPPRLGLEIYSSSGNVLYLNTAGVPVSADGAPHHFCATLGQASGTLCTVWLDGIPITSGSTSGAWIFGGDVVRFGRALDAYWANYDGLLTGIAWWNTILSAGSIMRLAQGAVPTTVQKGNIVAAWNLTSLLDFSGNGLHLTNSSTGIAADFVPRPRQAYSDSYYPRKWDLATGGMGMVVPRKNRVGVVATTTYRSRSFMIGA